MKSLGIDFGEKRVGLAISDPAGRFAVPSRVLKRTSDAQVIETLGRLVEDEEIDRIVLGLPLSLDGTPGPAATRVRSFARKLSRVVGVPVVLHDEALTSFEAERRLRESGPGHGVDAVAAQILLQEVLDDEALGEGG